MEPRQEQPAELELVAPFERARRVADEADGVAVFAETPGVHGDAAVRTRDRAGEKALGFRARVRFGNVEEARSLRIGEELRPVIQIGMFHRA